MGPGVGGGGIRADMPQKPLLTVLNPTSMASDQRDQEQ